MDKLTQDQGETNRLANLALYDILDSLPEQQYDDITHLAAHICQTPISLISFIDRDRQWFKSRLGFPHGQTAREISFCAHAILTPQQMMVIPDATKDHRFMNNPLVDPDSGVVFYAGVPLVTLEGHALGTLCVIDTKPGSLSEIQTRALSALARQVVALLTLRRQTHELQQAQDQAKQRLIRLQEAKQQLTNSLAKERELHMLKSNFVSMVSHEFRTPLATIGTSTDLITSYLEELKEISLAPFQRHLAIIKNEIKRFTDLLNSILTSSQLEAGKLLFAPQSINVVDLCRELLTVHFSHRPDGRRVKLTDVDQPIYLSIDAYLLTHVLLNLLSNAFKFSQEEPELVIRSEPTHLVLQVIDRGIGIPPQALPYLCEPFYRAGNAISIEGTGLGLSIACQFVELHGGSLSIESQEQQGTTVTVSIPTY